MNRTAEQSARAAFFASLGLATVVFAAGCSQKATPAAPAAAIPAAATALPLAVPLLDVMRAAVEIPADGIWAAQSADKLSNDEWLLADQDSAALAASTTLISIGGTGKNDPLWVANADWRGWTLQAQRVALQIREAAKARDKEKFNARADELTGICEQCHMKYRPENPSDGVARYRFIR